MPNYTSNDNVKSGIPLGGIGAGKLEILPNGTIDYITYQNNWRAPICNNANKELARAAGLLGFHFAVFSATQAGKKAVRLLQTEKVKKYKTIEKIEYEGDFPFAKLKYIDKSLPVRLELLAFSPLIPSDYKHSSTPGAVFSFSIKNESQEEIDISLMAIGRNTVGANSTGRFDSAASDKGLSSIKFNIRSPLPNDYSAGEVVISVAPEGGEATFLSGFNMQTENFNFSPNNINLDAINYFEIDGKLPDIESKIELQGGSAELGSAIAKKITLASGEEKKIEFFWTWYFPRHHAGHSYERDYKDAVSVAMYLKKEKNILEQKSRAWQEAIIDSKLPEWFKDALINNIYTLFSSSWLTRDGKFSMYEAPLICPLMGTLDVYFYGSFPIAYFFPELDKSLLMQFASSQRKNGYIPHDLGFERLDMASDGTTFYQWKDLNSKFVLMSYRAYLWANDKNFLKKIYPAMKKALEFLAASDKNGDHLPDNEGSDHTFDMWYFYGASSYCSGLYLSALLALKSAAYILGDSKTADKLGADFIRARKSFEDKLWNGKFFIVYNDGTEKYDSCMLSQLAGQWYAHVLGLGHIASREKVKEAVRNIASLNGRDSKFGATNSVFANKRRDKTSSHSGAVFPGTSYAFSSLAVYEGFVEEGLDITKRVWDNFVYRAKSPWNQPDLIDPDNGTFGFGDYYLRNSCIWSVLFALSKVDRSAARVLYGIKELCKQNTKY